MMLSHLAPRSGLSGSCAPSAPHEEELCKMNDTTEPATEPLQRIPGLYRRWELPEIFELHRRYHLEDAGAHADGTPLVAVYASAPEAELPTGEDG